MIDAPSSTPRLFAEGARRLGIELSSDQLDRFQRYHSLLLESAALGISGIDDDEEVQRRHLLETAALLTVLEREGLSLEAQAAVDVGSGAGIPGIPLKILRPALRLTLLEAKTRRVQFLRDALSALDLPDVVIVNQRAEEAGRDPAQREACDLALAKAVAPLPVLLELTLPLLRVGGVLAAPKGAEARREVSEAGRAIEELGGTLRAVVGLPRARPAQLVILVEKTAATPDRYPRRPGMPAKRPL